MATRVKVTGQGWCKSMILLRNITIAACVVTALQGTHTGVATAQISAADTDVDHTPTSVIFKIAGSPELRDLADATGRLIRVEVDRTGVVRTAGTPALFLEDLQMALGCLGETTACLRVVASELRVETLLYASLERAGGRLTLTLVYFDGTESRMVTDSIAAPAPDNAILESVAPLVREVFGLPPLPPIAAVARVTPGAGAARESDGRGLRTGAFVAAGVAVVAVGASAVFFHDASRSEERYREAPVGTIAQADAALRTRSRAESSGRAGVALVSVGGAAAVTAVVLGLLCHTRHPRDQARVEASVLVGPTELGLTLRGAL